MYIHDIDQDLEEAAGSANYALDSAMRILRREFDDAHVSPSDCVALAAIIMSKLNMVHDCDMRYLEMDRADRRTPKDRSTK